MGSLVVKLDNDTNEMLKNQHHYDDIDILSFKKYSKTGIEVPMVYDVEAVKMSVRNILMWRVGESILRPEFGHNIHKSMYEQINQFSKERVCNEIKRAIEDNEPRVTVDSVSIQERDEDSDSNTLNVQVVYTVNGDKTGKAEITEQTTIKGK